MINDVRYRFLYNISVDEACERLQDVEDCGVLMTKHGDIGFIELCQDAIKILTIRDTSEDYLKAAKVRQVLQGIKYGLDKMGKTDHPKYNELPDYPKEVENIEE